jgi:hypothetical protein
VVVIGVCYTVCKLHLARSVGSWLRVGFYGLVTYSHSNASTRGKGGGFRVVCGESGLSQYHRFGSCGPPTFLKFIDCKLSVLIELVDLMHK